MAKDRKYLSLDGEDLTRKRVCEEYHRHELSQQDAAIKLDMSTRQFRRIFTATMRDWFNAWFER
jgi:transcriptional regulator GlxA family with amidase domain